MPEHAWVSRRSIAITVTAVVVAIAAATTTIILTRNDATTPNAGPTAATSSAPAVHATPPATARATTAADVLAALGRAGLPMSNPAVQDENSDPNNLLGRPNGYVARASFDVAGGDTEGDKYGIDRGGVVEVWRDEAGARARSAFIQETLKGMPILGTEYHYVRGSVLLRITGKVKPSVAAQFETALAR